MINRFSVPPLFQSTKKLAKIASGIMKPDLVIFNARVLSTYTDRILENKEIWISSGRIVCVKENGVRASSSDPAGNGIPSGPMIGWPPMVPIAPAATRI